MTNKTSTNESLFRPCVTVRDDGTISIDWFDSYINSVVVVDGVAGDAVYTEPEDCPHSGLDCPHSGLLDSLVAGVGTVEGLRRLADYIEAQSA